MSWSCGHVEEFFVVVGSSPLLSKVLVTFAVEVIGAELSPGKLGRCHCRRHFVCSVACFLVRCIQLKPEKAFQFYWNIV